MSVHVTVRKWAVLCPLFPSSNHHHTYITRGGLPQSPTPAKASRPGEKSYSKLTCEPTDQSLKTCQNFSWFFLTILWGWPRLPLTLLSKVSVSVSHLSSESSSEYSSLDCFVTTSDGLKKSYNDVNFVNKPLLLEWEWRFLAHIYILSRSGTDCFASEPWIFLTLL